MTAAAPPAASNSPSAHAHPARCQCLSNNPAITPVTTAWAGFPASVSLSPPAVERVSLSRQGHAPFQLRLNVATLRLRRHVSDAGPYNGFAKAKRRARDSLATTRPPLRAAHARAARHWNITLLAAPSSRTTIAAEIDAGGRGTARRTHGGDRARSPRRAGECRNDEKDADRRRPRGRNAGGGSSTDRVEEFDFESQARKPLRAGISTSP